MTETELVAKWEARAAEDAKLGACADGAKISRAFLADVAQIRPATENRAPGADMQEAL